MLAFVLLSGPAVTISGVQAPSSMAVGQNATMTVAVSNSADSRFEGRVIVKHDGEKLAEQGTRFSAGKNEVAFTVPLYQTGNLTYTVQLYRSGKLVGTKGVTIWSRPPDIGIGLPGTVVAGKEPVLTPAISYGGEVPIPVTLRISVNGDTATHRLALSESTTVREPIVDSLQPGNNSVTVALEYRGETIAEEVTVVRYQTPDIRASVSAQRHQGTFYYFSKNVSRSFPYATYNYTVRNTGAVPAYNLTYNLSIADRTLVAEEITLQPGERVSFSPEKVRDAAINGRYEGPYRGPVRRQLRDPETLHMGFVVVYNDDAIYYDAPVTFTHPWKRGDGLEAAVTGSSNRMLYGATIKDFDPGAVSEGQEHTYYLTLNVDGPGVAGVVREQVPVALAVPGKVRTSEVCITC